ncbi:MAG: isochorismatase family protein [Sedimentisphaerales bacterium]|nr:isochorismatase family protein [Sedimentisphaerales bacterium]
MARKTLFWDVDTQYDFMMSDGKLYVKGAERIIPVINRLRATALDNGCSIVASMDWHSADNPEISDEPDFQTTFPPHCMAGSPGARRIGFLGKLPIHEIDPEPRDPDELADLVRHGQFHIALHKGSLDVFSNPNTVRLIESMPSRPERIVLFGVALDFCVKLTLERLARFTGTELVVVRDGTCAIDSEGAGQVLTDLERQGVQMTESGHLQEMVPCG